MKKKMKSAIIIGMALLCSLTVFGCGKKSTGGSDITDNDNSTSVTERDNDISTADSDTGSSTADTDDSSTADTNTDSSATKEETTQSLTSSASGTKVFSSIQDLFSNEDFQKALNSQPHETDDLTYKIYLDGNTIVYEYTYKEQIDNSTVSIVKQTLENTFNQEYIKSMCSQFIQIVGNNVDTDSLTFRFIFNNADGTKITEVEYTEKF